MPQFDYQQLCHFVLPEQGGLSVETILKRFLYLTPREIRHAKYIPDGIQKNGVSCRTNAVVQTGDTITFRYEQKCPHLSEDQVLPVSGDSAGVRILYEDSDLCVADKPSGMVCHASHGHYSDSLTHAAASLLKTPTAPLNSAASAVLTKIHRVWYYLQRISWLLPDCPGSGRAAR